jgi:hypothetical protein
VANAEQKDGRQIAAIAARQTPSVVEPNEPLSETGDTWIIVVSPACRFTSWSKRAASSVRKATALLVRLSVL